MIELRNLSKAYRTRDGWNRVLDDVSLVVPTGCSIGVLGLNGAGKSTLLRIIGGMEPPDSGRIIKDIRTSWPIGFRGGFQPNMSGQENVRFVARIYGADLAGTERFVAEFAELGSYYRMPLRTYSAGMRGRLGFAVSMALRFDCYLVDELTASGDRRFRQKYRRAFRDLQSHASFLMVSHQTDTIEEFCQKAAVLNEGNLTLYDSVEEGLEAYEAIAPLGKNDGWKKDARWRRRRDVY
jgi:capsular polysaccharide transport system ATP-binding protein